MYMGNISKEWERFLSKRDLCIYFLGSISGIAPRVIHPEHAVHLLFSYQHRIYSPVTRCFESALNVRSKASVPFTEDLLEQHIAHSAQLGPEIVRYQLIYLYKYLPLNFEK